MRGLLWSSVSLWQVQVVRRWNLGNLGNLGTTLTSTLTFREAMPWMFGFLSEAFFRRHGVECWDLVLNFRISTDRMLNWELAMVFITPMLRLSSAQDLSRISQCTLNSLSRLNWSLKCLSAISATVFQWTLLVFHRTPNGPSQISRPSGMDNVGVHWKITERFLRDRCDRWLLLERSLRVR